MDNFNFHNPTKILFGKGKIADISKEIPKQSKVLVTFGGGSIKKNGVYGQVKDALSGYSWDSFGGIEPNPRYETLMKAVQKIRNENFDYLLAVGGGSVIDGTKFIAAAVNFEGDDPWQIIKSRAKFSDALPFGAVLTLPATGSEMNAGAVVTHNATQEKLPFGNPQLYPKFSVLDPEVTATLPEKQAANGVVDAFVHVIEQYMNYDSGYRLQQYFAESILKTLIEKGPGYYKDPSDYESAANIMWCSTMALNGLIGAGVPQDWSTHMIGHELTAFHEIDHARTLAIVLPGTWKVMREQKKQRLVQYAENVWNIHEGSEEEKIEKATRKTEAFFNSLGIKTRLSDYNVGNDTVEKIIDRMSQRNWKLGESGLVTPDKVKLILEARA
ncbi:MAG TPA: iron-containing alcohol dehydrogenase [Bacteroidales bacterium]|nr:iron-containing alcohol dehydrogenase [Bacteroidales bacterium]